MIKRSKRLKRVLGFWDIFCLASGAMISSGLFILPGLAYAKSGPAVIFAYILAGILVIPSVLSKAELATAMPSAGGTYFYIERSLGPGFGTFGGFATWLSLSFKSAFALLGLGLLSMLLYPGMTLFQVKLLAIGFCLIFTVLNIVSVKLTGKVQIVLVLLLFASLIYYAIRGFAFIDVTRYVPFAPHGAKAIFATAGLVFISFGGLTKVASLAEEVKKPSLNIPLGMLIAFIVVAFFYALTVFITVGLVGGEELSLSKIPISLAVKSFAPLYGKIVIAMAAVVAFISTANAGILSASRSPMAMSRDKLLPKALAHINSRYGTPHVAIIATSALMLIVILFLDFENLVKTASTLKLILFMFVNLSVIIMRESKIQNYRPSFRSPFYPWLQIAAIFAYGFLIFEMGEIPLIITGVFIGVCCLWYLFYVSARAKRRSAIMHIVERITARELAGNALGRELKEIIKERDEIVEDRFDHLIKDAIIIDMKHKMSSDEAFKEISDRLSGRLDIASGELFKLFKAREELSSTVIQPGLAIPHIIVESKHKFDILPVRAKEGIIFLGASEPVKTMFVLIGSMDERNYHLRALMAIAQIAQEKSFKKKWFFARNIEALRDVILLSNRTRD